VDEAIICVCLAHWYFFFRFVIHRLKLILDYWLPVNDILIVLLFLLRSSTEANAYSQMLTT
jgi:hypothetical protein